MPEKDTYRRFEIHSRYAIRGTPGALLHQLPLERSSEVTL